MTQVPTFPWRSVEVIVEVELSYENWRYTKKETDCHLEPVDAQSDHS
jgi:hypothetical protein